MTITPSTPFQTGLDAKKRIPLYIAKILGTDWESAVLFQDTDRVSWYDTEQAAWYNPGDATGMSIHSRKSSALSNVKPYMKNPSALSQQVYPDEGRSSISSVTFEVIDKDNFFTELIALDQAAFLQNRKVELYAGYVDMVLEDFLIAFTGRVKDYPESSTGVYKVQIYDPQKATQRDLFRDAAEDNLIRFYGNPINLILAWYTSTGTGLNGNYDWFDVHNGLGIDVSDVNVDLIESIRDNYFPGDSHNIYYIASEPVKGKVFLEEQLYKLLNLYPLISGGGQYGLSVFKPPLPNEGVKQTFKEEDGDFIKKPQWSPNLQSLLNEVNFAYDYDQEEFLSRYRYINAASSLYRAEGKKTLKIESQVLKSGVNRFALKFSQRVAQRAFSRWANPPSQIRFSSPFRKLTTEAGDIISVTHSLIPDPVNGVRGISGVKMEVLKRTLDTRAGNTKFEVLDTGFDKGVYQAISGVMTVIAGLSSTSFTVSEDDGEKFVNLTTPEVSIKNQFMLEIVENVTITNMEADSSGVYTVTVDDMGLTPSAGWKIVFADYDNATTEQQGWGYIADSSDELGAADDAAHLIVP